MTNTEKRVEVLKETIKTNVSDIIRELNDSNYVTNLTIQDLNTLYEIKKDKNLKIEYLDFYKKTLNVFCINHSHEFDLSTISSFIALIDRINKLINILKSMESQITDEKTLLRKELLAMFN